MMLRNELKAGRGVEVVIIDFGLARSVDDPTSWVRVAFPNRSRTYS